MARGTRVVKQAGRGTVERLGVRYYCGQVNDGQACLFVHPESVAGRQ